MRWSRVRRQIKIEGKSIPITQNDRYSHEAKSSLKNKRILVLLCTVQTKSWTAWKRPLHFKRVKSFEQPKIVVNVLGYFNWLPSPLARLARRWVYDTKKSDVWLEITFWLTRFRRCRCGRLNVDFWSFGFWCTFLKEEKDSFSYLNPLTPQERSTSNFSLQQTLRSWE